MELKCIRRDKNDELGRDGCLPGGRNYSARFSPEEPAQDNGVKQFNGSHYLRHDELWCWYRHLRTRHNYVRHELQMVLRVV